MKRYIKSGYTGEPSSVDYGNYITESRWSNWTDPYTLFEQIVDKYFQDEDKIDSEVDKLYNKFKHNKYMQEAYRRWCESIEE